MKLDEIQAFCSELKGTTEDIKWEHHPVFSVGEKMYAIVSFEEDKSNRMSIKASVEEFEALTQLDGIEPAPYLARYHWIMLTDYEGMEPDRLKALIKRSYDLVFGKLPKKKRTAILEG